MYIVGGGLRCKIYELSRETHTWFMKLLRAKFASQNTISSSLRGIVATGCRGRIRRGNAAARYKSNEGKKYEDRFGTARTLREPFRCPNFDSGRRQIVLSHRRDPLLSCAVEPADSGDPRRLGVLSALEVILVDEDEPDVHVGAQLALAVTAGGGEGARGFRQFFVVFYRGGNKGLFVLLRRTQAEQLSKSRKALLATTYKPFSLSLYTWISYYWPS